MPNRLATSSSPYLLQHAHNPVDWHPWGEEAFALARQRNVPLFLSIGYSTCYWCHVMERESFENEATARQMNANFVCIKLDREERPDVDELYMAATVMMTGHGGWPMSVFLEPDTLRPFFCGTYYSHEPKYRGMPTFSQVLAGMADAYRNKREDVRGQAAQLAAAVAEHVAAEQPRAHLGLDTTEECVEKLLRMFDNVHGGFGVAPKFPQPVFIKFLLDVREVLQGDSRTAVDRAIRVTLDKMAMGGIHDHLAGGFHRYSVDATWTVPHFEKMLYDNAQLLSVYARATRVFDDAFYARVAQRIMRHSNVIVAGDGSRYFSAEDAEVDCKEGLNYLWTPDELRESVSAADVEFAATVFGVSGEPNFFDPHHKSEPGRWVLQMKQHPSVIASEMGQTLDEFFSQLDRVCDAMLAHRSKRKQPRVDDKTLASWSGMMASAVAVATGKPPMQLANLLATMMPAGKQLQRTWRGDMVHTAAMLEDYAAVINALVPEHEVEQTNAASLAKAIALYDEARNAFFDDKSGAFYDTRANQSDLFVRARSTHDGALPSGFSMMLHAMVSLWQATRNDRFARDAAMAIAHQSGAIAASPVGAINSVRALLRIYRTCPPAASTLRDLLPAADVSVQPAVGQAPQDAVQVFSHIDCITIDADTPAVFRVRVAIEPGYHVMSATATDGVIPFRIDVMNGRGIVAHADYPQPRTLEMGEDRVEVYDGDFEVPVVLERTGEWKGTPIVYVRYQVCSDTACFAPTTVELDISLDRA